MGYEEGFSSVKEPGEKRRLFSSLHKSNEPVVERLGVVAEAPDAFLANLRLQVTVLQAIDLDLKQLNKTMLCVGEVLDELKEELLKPKGGEVDESRIE